MRSFISNSKPSFSRYAFVVAVLYLVYAGSIATILGWQYWVQRDTDNTYNLAYQLAKFRTAKGIDTVFVGDSALGNAISAKTFDRESGVRSLNLALTGTDGYAASYNMIRRAVSAFPDLRNVVIFQTADVTSRGTSYHGWLYTTPDFDLSIFGARQLFRLAVAFLRIHNNYNFAAALVATRLDKLAPGWFWPAGEQAFHFYTRDKVDPEIDYIPQIKTARPVSEQIAPYDPKKILADSRFFLDRIHDLCGLKHLKCIFAFGPMVEEEQASSRAFLEKSADLIRQSGLELLSEHPISMTVGEMGDTHHHNRPDLKDQMTKRYARALSPWLSGGTVARSVR